MTCSITLGGTGVSTALSEGESLQAPGIIGFTGGTVLATSGVMASIESVVSEQLAQAFTVLVPHALQPQMDLLPLDVRHSLLSELFRLAVQAWQERCLLPRKVPVHLEFLLAGCDVGIELDASRARLTLVSLTRERH